MSLREASLHTANLDAWRSALLPSPSHSPWTSTGRDPPCETGSSRSAAPWLLVLEDDAELPPPASITRGPHSFLALLRTVVDRHPHASVLWLDSRSRYARTEPGGCCTSALLYKKSFLPSLLRHLELDPLTPIMRSVLAPSKRPRHTAFDQVLSRLLKAQLPGQSATVPIVGTIGLSSTITSGAVSGSHWNYSANAKSWPEWLHKEAKALPFLGRGARQLHPALPGDTNP